jgi:hypothetical protein
MSDNSRQPALRETWTPFWGPIERLGEKGIVLYLQGRDYKAEDALALIDLLRFVPQGCQERVRFLPMQANLQTVLHLGEIKHALSKIPPNTEFIEWAGKTRRATDLIAASTEREPGRLPNGNEWKSFWDAICAFAADFTDKAVPDRPPKASQLQLGIADAENLIIIGRPEYYTAWWHQKRVVRELVCRAGYPSRYAFPDRGKGLDVAQPIGNALFDRKWLLQYGQIEGRQEARNQDTAAEPVPGVEHDYGLVLHSQVTFKGALKKVTLCVGCHALGTWAATRFAADPSLFRQIGDSGLLDGEEFPLEILLRVKKEVSDPNGLAGMNDLTPANIRILNNDPREYLGQIFDPPCERCEPKCGAGGAAQTLRLSHALRQRSDIGRSLRDLRRLLIQENGESLLDATRQAVLGGLPARRGEDPYGVWKEVGGRSSAPPREWRSLCPQFTAHLVDRNIRIVLRRSQLRFGTSGKLLMGPRLFALLWEALALLVTRGRTDSRPYRPILVLGGSGSGKDPLVGALRHGWHYLLSKSAGNNRILEAERPSPLNTAELVESEEGIAERLKVSLRDFAEHEGSLFLDEFSDMSISSQVSLLRLLQDGSISPSVAPDPDMPAKKIHNAMILAATSQPLDAMAKAGSFREDLLFRFSRVKLPDLSQRPLDALALFACELTKKHGSLPITLAALKLFLADPFHGNVRTLLKETLPRIHDIWHSVRRGGAALQFRHLAEALSLPSIPSGLGEQLFDDPEKACVLLNVDNGEDYGISDLMENVIEANTFTPPPDMKPSPSPSPITS